MGRHNSGKERYNFLIDPIVYADFSKVCAEHGLIRSKKIELLMKSCTSNSSGIIIKSSKTGRYNFLIDPQVYSAFSQMCAENGLVRSKKIELLIKEFVNEQSKIFVRRSSK